MSGIRGLMRVLMHVTVLDSTRHALHFDKEWTYEQKKERWDAFKLYDTDKESRAQGRDAGTWFRCETLAAVGTIQLVGNIIHYDCFARQGIAVQSTDCAYWRAPSANANTNQPSRH